MYQTLIVISVLILLLISSVGFQYALACQCIRQSPETYSQRSDVIFLGRIVSKERAAEPDLGSYITFAVLKSWKGVDAEKVSVYSDGSLCGSFPFIIDDSGDEEYLVYGTTTFSEIKVTMCGGTIQRQAPDFDFSQNPYMSIDLSIAYLDDHFNPIQLREGHTRSENVLVPLQVLGGLLAIAGATFAVIRWR